MFNNEERNTKSCKSNTLKFEKLLELGLPSNFFNKQKRLLCPICRTSQSPKGIVEHLADKHLPHHCLQIAKCINAECTKKRDIFTVNFLTDHFMEERCEHELIYPKKKCRHRVNCQIAMDTLMEISIYLGFVDDKGNSIDPDHRDRIDAFKRNSATMHSNDFFFTSPHIDPKKKVACFITEDRDDRERNGSLALPISGGDYQEYERSPAYGRSPVASPGPVFGGCSLAGGRSPSGTRSPARYEGPSGCRSPGGAAGYDEPERGQPRSFIRPNAKKVRATEQSSSSRNDGSSRPGNSSINEGLMRIKEEPIDSTPAAANPPHRNSSPPANRVPHASFASATSSIPLPPTMSQLGDRGHNNGFNPSNHHAFPNQHAILPNGGYSAYPHMTSTPQVFHNPPHPQSKQFAQYGNGYKMTSSSVTSERRSSSENRSSDASTHHSSGTNHREGSYSRRQDEQRPSYIPPNSRSHNQSVPNSTHNRYSMHNSSPYARPPPPRPQLDGLLSEFGRDNRDARSENTRRSVDTTKR